MRLNVDEKKELAEYIQKELPYREIEANNGDSLLLSAQLKRLEDVQTGGNTYCYCMLYHFNLKQNIAQNFCIIKKGEFPLYDIRYRVLNMDKKKEILNQMHGELNSPADFHIVKWHLTDKIYYRFFFHARNGSWNQDLILKKSENHQCWLAATIVKDKLGREIVYKHIDNGFKEEFGEPVWQP